MSSPRSDDDAGRVRVAVRVRPLLPFETEGPKKARDCVTVVNNSLTMGAKQYTFDHVYDTASEQEEVYTGVVHPLVESCFEGFNGTVFAYGQTGSGKTHTMGTSSGGGDSEPGVLPRAIESIFKRVSTEVATGKSSFSIKVSYIEVYTDIRDSGPMSKAKRATEEVRDLLVFDTASGAPTRRGAFGVKSRIPEVTVRDDGKGGIKLDGVQERTVESTEQALGFLERYVRLVLA